MVGMGVQSAGGRCCRGERSRGDERVAELLLSSTKPIGFFSGEGLGVGRRRVSTSALSSRFGRQSLAECGVEGGLRGRDAPVVTGVGRRRRDHHPTPLSSHSSDVFGVSSSAAKGCGRRAGGGSASVDAQVVFGRGRDRRRQVWVEGGRSYGEINGSLKDGESADDDSEDSSVVIEDAVAGAGRGEDLDAAISAAAVEARRDEVLRNIQHPLDYVYAVMPQIQERLKEATGREGTGAGYEDVRVGFYRDTNLKPMNWKDAMVSMKPGSGTEGLDLDWDDEESDQSQTRDARLVPEGSERDGRRGGYSAPTVGTRYGGPVPGTHGPWRWGQVEKGSALEKKLKAEMASFPRRLPRRLRRYYHDKLVWVTGADHGIGEQVAINLTVNGAKVILSGTDLRELERVQRLCILAWMKAVNWEIVTAFLKGWTRLDRAMVLPLDVRDDFILPDAVSEAEDMLDRPVDMLFNFAGASTKTATDLYFGGAVALTKAVLPSMLDAQDGHVVVITGEGGGEGSATAGDVASWQTSRGYFDSVRAEVARDNVKITVAMHPGPSDEKHAAPSSRALPADLIARRLLAAVSRGRQEVFLERRALPLLEKRALSVLARLGIGGASKRAR
eukprot:jgi/Undpi1/2320/HiC_scaffold_13.g05703.m1